jgi:hypothetical protein
MSAARRLASSLLSAMVRCSSSDSQDWVHAMLRELDFIESDWESLFWALGSTAAIFRYSFPRGLRAWLGKHSGREGGLMTKNIREKTVGVISGVVIAVAVLATSAFGLVRLSLFLFPAWDVQRVPWAEWLAVIAIPETIFIFTAISLWRKRRSMAVGILLSAIVLVAHFVVHITTHG